jgi:hypothetical protein
MEQRLAHLIGKLNEQFEQNADPTQLLVTTQQIEAELLRLSSASRQALSTSKVSVVMPANNRHYNTLPAVQIIEEKEEKAEEIPEPPPVAAKETQNGVKMEDHYNGLRFDPLREIPTLAHQQAVKELNEVMAPRESSLNDKLKEDIKEVAHVLTDSPVRDLRRAIGINERYVFISELFRGDEVMYERSIKTINGFRIFPEAEYWIERELKVKLGWDEGKPTTRHFYQLIKRRFS